LKKNFSLSLDELGIKKNAEIAVAKRFDTTSLPKRISAIKGMWVMDMSSRIELLDMCIIHIHN
jgi:hypothetical protein